MCMYVYVQLKPDTVQLEIWWGIKFGSLAIYLCDHQIKIRQYFYTCTYTYGDPLPSHQI